MATYYFRNANGNWNAANNWSTSDGGPANGAVPTNADDAYFTSNSGACTLTAAGVCKTLVFSGVGAGNYANTFTVNATITVSGNVTLSSTMTITTTSGTPLLAINATATLTSAGKTWTGSMSFAGTSQTYTWADSWTISGNITFGGTTSSIHTGAVNVNVGGNMVINTVPTYAVGGSATSPTIVLNGTGTISGTAQFRLHLTINTAGTITFPATFVVGGNIFTYTAGTVTSAASCTLSFTSATNYTSLTFNTAGMTWGSLSIGNIATIILSADLKLAAAFAMNNLVAINGATFYVYVGTNLTTTSTSATTATGTFAGIIMNGTGTINAPSTPPMGWAITINTTGTITLGNWQSRSTSFTVTAGTVVSTGTWTQNTNAATYTINGTSCAFNIFNNAVLLTFQNNTTCSFTTLSTTSNITFQGTTGITFGTLSSSTAGIIITLVSSNTYTVTTALTLNGTSTSSISLASSTANTSAKLTLNSGATQSVSFITATDVDSSGGQTIWCWSPTLSNTLNWKSLLASVFNRGGVF